MWNFTLMIFQKKSCFSTLLRYKYDEKTLEYFGFILQKYLEISKNSIPKNNVNEPLVVVDPLHPWVVQVKTQDLYSLGSPGLWMYSQ